MKKAYKKTAVALLLLLLPLVAQAQFFTAGDDPGCRRWYSIESENYRIIYPRGLDSLARVYAREMERFRKPVGLTSGYLPGECIRGKMPVVLHAYNSVSNGSVAWAPKRMDAYTMPQVYGAEATPWPAQLAVHESRHISQMQFGLSHAQRPFGWFFGEMWNGLTAGLYTENSLLEGDAVIAETELTRSGRGRKADFLNYYMVCFDQGDLRDWDQWRFGSQRNYTPDWYALGYLTYGGLRWMYDRDDYMAEYLDYASRHPLRLDVREVVAKRTTGKDLVNSFPAVRDSVTAVWRADAEKRRPYMAMEQVTGTPKKPADYESLLVVGDELFAVKHGYTDNYQLIKIQLPTDTDISENDADDDISPKNDANDDISPKNEPTSRNMFSERFVTHFGSYAGALKHSPVTDRLYWSESVSDARWTLKYTSRIRNIRVDGKTTKSLTNKGWMYNPVPSEKYAHAVAVENRPEGGSRLTFINLKSGKREMAFDAPDSLQFVETAWSGDEVYVSGISGNGFGIYRLDVAPDHRYNLAGAFRSPNEFCYEVPVGEFFWEKVLKPQPVQIKNLQSGKRQSGESARKAGEEEFVLLFTSDRTGVNELYSLNPADGTLRQLTSTRYGASDYQFDEDGRWLYYSSQTTKGKMIFRTAAGELFNKEADWNERYSWPIAEKLSEQARRRAEKLYGNAELLETEAARADTMTLSKPRRYHKIPQMFRVHSWAPFYANIPVLMNANDLGDNIFDYVNLGATAVLQNQLGTFSGIVGYSAHKDPYDKARWRHSAHLNLKYTGLYPVFELNIDFNDRAARQSGIALHQVSDNAYSITMRSEAHPSVPNISGSISAYIPFKFSSGGWSRGFTPRVSYYISNDRRDANAYIFKKAGIVTDGKTVTPEGVSMLWVPERKMKSFKNLPAQNLTASASLYGVLPVNNSGVFPRWGGGVQAGLSYPLGMTHWYSPAAFGYAYGYFPGVVPEQGLKLTGMWQGQMPTREKGRLYTGAPFSTSALNILPRGIQEASLRSALVQHTESLAKFTADYAIPIYVGDRSLLWSCLYVRRLLLTPHFDCTLFSNSALGLGSGPGALMTYGFDLALDIQCILWLTIPCTLGVSVNFNGAPDWNGLTTVGKAIGIPNVPKFYIGPVLSINMF